MILRHRKAVPQFIHITRQPMRLVGSSHWTGVNGNLASHSNSAGGSLPRRAG